MIDKIFQSLDRDNKGYVSYNDFCELAEERRRNIDAFELDPATLTKYRSPNNKDDKGK